MSLIRSERIVNKKAPEPCRPGAAFEPGVTTARSGGVPLTLPVPGGLDHQP